MLASPRADREYLGVKMKAKIIIGLLVVVFILFFLGVPSNIRYYFEKRFGDPHTFFYDVNLAIKLKGNNYYTDEFYLDDNPRLRIDISPYQKSEIEMFLYGGYTNSADPLIVILNDKVIFNGHGTTYSRANFYGRIYITKRFVVELEGFNLNGTNKIIVSTGNANETYFIDTITGGEMM